MSPFNLLHPSPHLQQNNIKTMEVSVFPKTYVSNLQLVSDQP